MQMHVGHVLVGHGPVIDQQVMAFDAAVKTALGFHDRLGEEQQMGGRVRLQPGQMGAVLA